MDLDSDLPAMILKQLHSTKLHWRHVHVLVHEGTRVFNEGLGGRHLLGYCNNFWALNFYSSSSVFLWMETTAAIIIILGKNNFSIAAFFILKSQWQSFGNYI